MNPEHPAKNAADLAGLIDELDLLGEPAAAARTAARTPPTADRAELDAVLSSRLALRFEDILARDEHAIAVGAAERAAPPPPAASGPGLFERALAASPREQILGRLVARGGAEPATQAARWALGAAVRSYGRDVFDDVEADVAAAAVDDDRALLEAERIMPERWGDRGGGEGGGEPGGLVGVLSQRLHSTVPGIDELLAAGCTGRGPATSTYEALGSAIASSAATLGPAVDLLATLAGFLGASPALSWLITAIAADTSSRAAQRRAIALGLVATAARQPHAGAAPTRTPAARPAARQDDWARAAMHAESRADNAAPRAAGSADAAAERASWAQLGSLDAVTWLGAQLSALRGARGDGMRSSTATAPAATAPAAGNADTTPRSAAASSAEAARATQVARALATWAVDHRRARTRATAALAARTGAVTTSDADHARMTTAPTTAEAPTPARTTDAPPGGAATALVAAAPGLGCNAGDGDETAATTSRGPDCDEVLAQLRAAGDLAGLLEALGRRGARALDDGELDAAVDLLDEAAAVAEAVRRPAHAAQALLGAASALRGSGRIDHAITRARRATALAPGGPSRVAALTGLGECQRVGGDLEGAAQSYGEALALGRGVGLRPFHQGALLRRRAAALHGLGRIDAATTDLSAALAAYDKAGASAPRRDTLVERAAMLIDGPTTAWRAAIDAAHAAAERPTHEGLLAETAADDAPRADLALLEASRATRDGDLPDALAWAERARCHALAGSAPLTYAAAALAAADLSERASDRLGAYTSLVIAWATLADRLGADLAAAWFRPPLAAARSRWGEATFLTVRTTFAATHPGRR